jgi:hypothetical protein
VPLVGTAGSALAVVYGPVAMAVGSVLWTNSSSTVWCGGWLAVNLCETLGWLVCRADLLGMWQNAFISRLPCVVCMGIKFMKFKLVVLMYAHG